MARSEVVGRWWAASHADGLTCTAALIVSCPPQEQAERRADLNATRPVFLPCGAGSAVPEAEPAGSLLLFITLPSSSGFRVTLIGICDFKYHARTGLCQAVQEANTRLGSQVNEILDLTLVCDSVEPLIRGGGDGRCHIVFALTDWR